MGRALVIVESPAKAKTINKYLGKDFIVKSSVGHVRDLPQSGSDANKIDPSERARIAAKTRKLPPGEKEEFRKKRAKEQMIRRMSIDPENNWAANYVLVRGKEKVVEELRSLAAKTDLVYLATDLDREGESIAWHLQEIIGGSPEKFRRVVFHEITKKAIIEAFKNPGSVDMDRVRAQQTRRFLDRIVGFMVSPLLWAKIARGLSAGRVQSVAVRLIVEREREIMAFVPEEFWDIYAHLHQKEKKNPVKFEVKKTAGKAFRPGSEKETREHMAVLEKQEFRVTDRQDRPTIKKPYAPFMTSTLQQWASVRLGFSIKKIMLLAQRLYEAGHITYMRTDSTNLSADAVEDCRAYIGKNYGNRYVPGKPNVYASRETAQEAHEAIRPTNIGNAPGMLQGLERDAERLYELVWRQFVACQMTPAQFMSTGVTVQAGDYELKTRGRVIKFDGFMKIIPAISRKEDDQELPDFKVGEILDLDRLEPKQHFTKSAPRYTEASLVKELEKRGIGRPSTYANIISTIQDRGYVREESKRFYAEKMGEIVTDRLVENFSKIMSYGFTADMETVLDKVADGDTLWTGVLDEFYSELSELLDTAYDGEKGMRPNNPTDVNIECPSCGRNMQIRTAATGVFLGCSGYSLPAKERCKKTINLIHGHEAIKEGDAEAESFIFSRLHRCPKCGTAMDNYLIDENRKLHVCGNNPDCSGFEIEYGKFKIKGYDGPSLECDKCGAEMQLKTGRFGKYFGCTNEECKNTRKLLRSGEPAPPKMVPVKMPELPCENVDDFYLLRDGAAGLFLAASKFPQHRETRAPLVEELIPHKDEIDPKYSFLFCAPTEDPDGNKAIVRFLRKTKEIYVTSEKDRKNTGWRAFYADGRWVVEDSQKKN